MLNNKYIEKLLSFVIPCYRSEYTIEKVINEIVKIVHERPEWDYEIICVNDCSPDGIYELLVKLATDNKKIKVVNLSKNMGKHAAVLAGYAFVRGQYTVNLDDDFQSPTYELWRLIEPLEKDECDIAMASYLIKKEKIWKRFGSMINSAMSSMMIGKPKELRFENFSVQKYFLTEEIRKYTNPYPYLEGLILQVTHRIRTIPMEQRERGDSNMTGFTLHKSISLFLNGLTAFSVKPLRMATLIGSVMSFASFLYAVYIVLRKLHNPSLMIGYSSIMCVVLFSCGMIMFMIGLIGEYVGRIYICLNRCSQYVVRDTINCE